MGSVSTQDQGAMKLCIEGSRGAWVGCFSDVWFEAITSGLGFRVSQVSMQTAKLGPSRK